MMMPRGAFATSTLLLFLLSATTAQEYCCKPPCGPTGREGPSPFHAFCSHCCGSDPSYTGSPEVNSCLRYVQVLSI